ncbi:hypothetical protein BJ138DRAFT_489679 [Hygrophoropsis aurantiaca]|uniref:Uncharacterized protein n=1 Tax=Hygrophoropsis aurantiaca TaxID=72124 RepID=A0ACB8AMC0_9AGAM|nr:hypothetical protein BJ138DRAFT_489679 [Hygrophoropsis aurantiaca]
MAAIPDLSLILGPVQIGVAASSFLTGCLTIQTYIYYSKFSSDPCLLKAFVAFLVLLEIINLLCMIISQWQGTFSSSASPTADPFVEDAVVVLSGLIFFCAQSFFVLRLLKLSNNNKYLALACLVPCVGVFIAEEVIAAYAFMMTSFEQFANTRYLIIITTLVMSAVHQIVVTAGLMYYLFKLRKTGFSRTTMTIDNLMLWTVGTGLIPCICVITTLICFAMMRDNYIWIGLYAILASTYPNACLAALNSRAFFNNKNAVNMLDQNPKIPKPSGVVINITTSSHSTASDDDKGQTQDILSSRPVDFSV